jgi:hypothetical protein
LNLNRQFLYQKGPFKKAALKCQGQIAITSQAGYGISPTDVIKENFLPKLLEGVT